MRRLVAHRGLDFRRRHAIDISAPVLCLTFVYSSEDDVTTKSLKPVKVLYLHHSTGNNVWKGGVPEHLAEYNNRRGADYRIAAQAFPKEQPYGWANYPFDYWNIWVNHPGPSPFKEEPTLEMLTKDWDVIVLKHCYPVSDVLEDTGSPDVASNRKSFENYKLQYAALKAKLRSFPNTKFIVWTGALRAADDTAPEKARRAQAFYDWMRNEWDEPGDNVFVWDFAAIEGEGGFCLKPEYQAEPKDSHPGPEFCKAAAPLFVRRLIDVIEGRGDSGSLTGG
jgi:hypothetical protein